LITIQRKLTFRRTQRILHLYIKKRRKNICTLLFYFFVFLQPSPMANDQTTSSLEPNLMYNIPTTRTEQYDARTSCKLRRQHPVKRESSRRIVVRPVVQRRREPSIGSSCESLDELCSSISRLPNEQVLYFCLQIFFKSKVI